MAKRQKSFFKKRKNNRRKILVFFVFIGVLFFLPRYFASPVSSLSDAEMVEGKKSCIYHYILKKTLPGFDDVRNNVVFSSREIINNTLMALVEINPADPKTFVSSQISGMASFSDRPLVLPVLHETLPEKNIPAESLPVLLLLDNEVEPFDYNWEEMTSPGIIIYHAHTTESFVPTSGERFTSDLLLTVAYLGAELKRILEEKYNIPVLHNYKIHDILRRFAYREARKTIKELIEKAPEAKMKVDFHRDGVSRNITTADIRGEKTGRILMVVGSGHERWRQNLQIARMMHEKLEEMAPGLSRGIKERSFIFNQDLHPGALLIEVGGHENSLQEAENALPYLARALAQVFVILRQG